MATLSYTTGPIYVDPPIRVGDTAFGLIISLFFGMPSVKIQSIELYAAPNTGFNTPEEWIRILLIDPLDLDDEQMINIVEEVRSGYPYYQWIITYESSEQVCGITHALYLLDRNRQALSDLALIPNGDWTPIPTDCLVVD